MKIFAVLGFLLLGLFGHVPLISAETGCTVYARFDGRKDELAGKHVLKIGSSEFEFTLGARVQIRKFSVACDEVDFILDDHPLLPLVFAQGRACVRIVRKHTLRTKDGFQDGFTGKEASKFWYRGKFDGAGEVQVSADDPDK